ncbi:RHS repeat domain-containing protein [Pseudidiomarina donghaiensis]|uniref:RHS repeat domain-containing protein n=1 Tax=Pseudidiomarina donghaiensis TaxID=519452 RepID=UPI001F5430A7|nr:RHS repeat-associated core domain-containing protein [Pseudidiomarina donghaiensis]
MQRESASTSTETTYLLFKDHLGSVFTTLATTGEIISQQLFSAFGQTRTIYTTGGVALGSMLPPTEQGFTGHRQMDALGIVHMKGRIYDPTLGRFLQADPFVQAPKNSQNYNRYSYVLNNPMSYTDPSGYFFKSLFKGIKKYWRVIAAAVVSYFTFGAASGWASSWALSSGLSASAAGFTGAVVGGAAAGFVSGAIMTGSLRGAMSGALAGAITGGIFEGIAQYGFNTSTVTEAASAMLLEEAGVPRETIMKLYSEGGGHTSHVKVDANGDPIPDQVIDSAMDTKLGLKMKDGKLTGSIDWACNGGQELCNQSMKYFDEVVSTNSDLLDITNNLISDYSSADAYLNFTSNKSPYARGHWNNSVKVIKVNRNSIVLKRALQHEYGHSLGLFHRTNDTMNFMSYYGLGSTYQNIAPQMNAAQRRWLIDAYTPWYKFW